MRIRWTEAAADDLTEISEYLREHHPSFRQATLRRLYRDVGGLRSFPWRGRAGLLVGTRELLFIPLPYIAVYRVDDDLIQVLRFYHAAQMR